MRTAFLSKTLTYALLMAALLGSLAPVAFADWLAYENLENGQDIRVWANTGGEKIPREIVRSYVPEPGTDTINSVWDGSIIKTFGARNEVISFAVIVDNNGAELNDLSLEFDLLENPAASYILETTEHRVSRMFDWRQRPIEVFVVEYLRIHGLSRISYAFDDETHIPEKLRRPIPVNIQPLAPAVGEGVWADRPHHDLSYPDIAIPQEVQEANGGTALGTNESQTFWIDIYIPKDAPAGMLSGTVSLSQGGIELLPVPVEIEVLNFVLPDERHSKTMVYIEPRDIKERYFTGVLGALAGADEQAYRDTINKHFMLAWRHGISLFDANEMLPDQIPDVEKPNVDWVERLNGNLYTQSNGYVGPGQNLAHDLYVVGSYGAWAFWWDLLEYNPRNSAYDPDAPLAELEASLVANTSTWENWFVANSPDTTRIFYIDDEPGTTDALQYAETIASIVENSPLAGSQLGTLVTASPVDYGAQLPSPSILSALISEGDTPVWDAALLSNPDREYHMYNGKRPASGTFAIEDDGVALREIPWGQYKKNIDRWFYWHATYYNNTQAGPPQRDMSQIAGGEGESYRSGSHTNVFKSAHTFGGHQAQFNDVRGEAGFNYGNGDGVLFYPGTDHVFPAENRGLDGPIASLRIKHWRRGIQDVQYLALAADIDSGATNAIVDTIVPEALWEIGVANPAEPSYVNKAPSWSNDPDLWEQARRDLATIIEAEPEPETAAPEITEHPESQTLTQGDELVLVVSATGNPIPTYQWHKDGVDIVGAASATFSIASTELTDAGNFDVTVTNSEGSETSNVAIVTVDPSLAAPEFTLQPESLSATEGDTVTFSAEVTGFPEPTLQWHKDSSPIAGETSNTLVIEEVAADDAGVYELHATNDQGTTISDQAVLTIEDPLAAPEILEQPQSATLTVGDALLLTVVAEGNPAPTYQWRKDGSDILGATSASFEIAAVEESDAGTYDVVVTNSESSVVSEAATVTVELAPFAPEFTLQPQSVNATEGDTVTLVTEVSGSPQPTLQWHKDGAPIAGETSNTLVIDQAAADDAGVYELHATNDQGTTVSDQAVVTIDAALAAPTISSQPQSLALTVGDTLQLTVVAEGNPTPTYQWSKDGNDIAGAISASFEIAAVEESDAGTYVVAVTNSESSVVSEAAIVTVEPAPFAPEFTLQPQSVNATEGDAVTLTTEVSGLPQPTLQWHKDGTPIAGATSNILTIATAEASDAGVYELHATNDQGTTISASAVVTVNEPLTAPQILTQPQSATLTVGDALQLLVVAEGNPVPTYQWRKNGNDIAGATSASFQIAAVEESDAGTYVVAITNSESSVVSEAAIVTVEPAPFAPEFTLQPQSVNATEGDAVTLTTEVSGLPQPTLQWHKDGTPIAGATSNILTIATAEASDAGVYELHATNDQGTTISASAVVTVNEPLTAPQILTQPQSATLSVGDALQLLVVAEGNPVPTYQWRKNGNDIAGATSASLSIATIGEIDAGSYGVVVTNSEDSVVSNSVQVVVEPAPVAPEFILQPQSQTVFEGDSVALSVQVNGFPAPTLQWQKDGQPLAGEIGTSLAIAAASATDAGIYNVVATNSEGTITSFQAVLAVSPVFVSPTFTEEPQDQSVSTGENVTFTASATGVPTVAYQWLKDGVAIAGETSSELQINPAAVADSGEYSVQAINSAGQLTSVSAELLVAAPEPPVSGQIAMVVANPANLLVGDAALRNELQAQGHVVTLFDDNVVTTENSAANSLVVIAGSVNSGRLGTRLANDPRPILIGKYSVYANMGLTGGANGTDYGRLVSGDTIVVESAGSLIGATAGDLEVLTRDRRIGWGAPAAQAEVIATAEGDPTRATVFAYAQGTTLANGSSAAGKRLALYLTGYTVNVSSDDGDTLIEQSVDWLLGDATPLTLSAPLATSAPTSVSVEEGIEVSFSASFSGNPTPTYQWLQDGVALAGANSTSLTVTASPTTAGSYALQASNSQGTALGDSATLTLVVDEEPPTVVSVSASSLTSLLVQFSEPVTAESAETLSNYLLTSGTTIIAAQLTDATTVELVTEELSPQSIDTLLISDVTDLSNNLIVTISEDFTTPAAPPPPSASAAIAMVVASPANLLVGDAALRNELQAQGHVVTLFDDNVVTTENSAANSLVVIAGSVNSGRLGTRLANDPRPILIGKYSVYANMGLTGGANGTDYGRLVSGDTIVVESAGSLIGATAGDLEVLTRDRRIGWGAPAAQAEVIATAEGDPTRATVFAYAQGTTLANGSSAAGKRLALYLTGYTVNVSSDDGDTLIEQSVDWLLGDATPLTLSAPLATSAPTSVSVEEGIEVSFSASFSGNPTPTYQWLQDGVALAGANSTSLTVTASPTTAGSYALQASNSQGTALGDSATLTLVVDEEPPTVVSVSASSLTSLLVQFSEPVTAESAETLSNYLLTSGTTIIAAQLTDATTVELVTEELSPQSIDTLLISDVTDLSNNLIVTISEDFTTPAAPPPPSASAAIAMVVASPANLLVGDAALRNELQAQGHVVTLFDDNVITTENSAANSLVVIAGSVNSGRLGTRLANDPRPILIGKYSVYANMGLTGGANGTDYGRLVSGDTIVVESAGSLIGATAGDLEVLTRDRRIGWGAPAAQAEVIATAEGDPTRATVFAYAQGTTLANGSSAAGKRLALYLTGYTVNVSSDDGDTLIEQSVDWLLTP